MLEGRGLIMVSRAVATCGGFRRSHFNAAGQKIRTEWEVNNGVVGYARPFAPRLKR